MKKKSLKLVFTLVILIFCMNIQLYAEKLVGEDVFAPVSNQFDKIKQIDQKIEKVNKIVDSYQKKVTSQLAQIDTYKQKAHDALLEVDKYQQKAKEWTAQADAYKEKAKKAVTDEVDKYQAEANKISAKVDSYQNKIKPYLDQIAQLKKTVANTPSWLGNVKKEAQKLLDKAEAAVASINKEADKYQAELKVWQDKVNKAQEAGKAYLQKADEYTKEADKYHGLIDKLQADAKIYTNKIDVLKSEAAKYSAEIDKYQIEVTKLTKEKAALLEAQKENLSTKGNEVLSGIKNFIDDKLSTIKGLFSKKESEISKEIGKKVAKLNTKADINKRIAEIENAKNVLSAKLDDLRAKGLYEEVKKLEETEFAKLNIESHKLRKKLEQLPELEKYKLSASQIEDKKGKLQSQLQKLKIDWKKAITKYKTPTDSRVIAVDKKIQAVKKELSSLNSGDVWVTKTSTETSASDSYSTDATGKGGESNGGVDLEKIVNTRDVYDEVPDGNNWCGQYATYAILKNHFGKDISFKELYQETNPGGIFSAPDSLVKYANKAGVKASKHNNSTIEDLKAQLDKGYPVTILGTDSFFTTPHYIAVKGYTTDENGNIKSIKVVDSCYMKEIPIDDFKKMWGNPLKGLHSSLGVLGGYKNLMITYDGSRSSSFDCSFDDVAANAITDAVAGWKNKNVGQLLGVIPKLAGGLLGAIPTAVGRGIDWLGSKPYDWGKKKWNEGGFLNKVAGGAAVVGGGIVKGVGKVVEFSGNVVSKIGDTLGNGVKAVGNFFSGL